MTADIDLLLEQVRGKQWRSVCIETARLSILQPSQRRTAAVELTSC